LGKSIDIRQIRVAVRHGKIEWQRHALERMAERGILRGEVKEALLNGELIECYPGDYPLPSGLFMTNIDKRPLHVVAAYNSVTDTVYVITVYIPSLKYFEPDLKTRRTR